MTDASTNFPDRPADRPDPACRDIAALVPVPMGCAVVTLSDGPAVAVWASGKPRSVLPMESKARADAWVRAARALWASHWDEEEVPDVTETDVMALEARADALVDVPLDLSHDLLSWIAGISLDHDIPVRDCIEILVIGSLSGLYREIDAEADEVAC